nr:acyl-CoA synthetase [Luteolibacter marinus]
MPLIARAKLHQDRTAIGSNGREFTYADLLRESESLATALLDDATDLAEARVAFMAPAGFDYFVIQWAIWRAGGIALPLSNSATTPELAYALADADARQVIVPRSHADKLAEPCREAVTPLLVLDEIEPQVNRNLPEIDPGRRAMILYTSGTTSRPKGVVTTHANIQAQIETLVEAWEWHRDDRIPLFLPMHHIHGIINIASCALWSGARVETFPRFELSTILEQVAARAYSVFMAVPTIYVKLIEALESDELPGQQRRRILDGFASMRLMVSGSAALPPSIHHKWSELTGQRLLERYGMTETAMMISNPYHGERRPGAVGQPLPGVDIRLKSETGDIVLIPGEPGEIQVKGPTVFREYWKRPEITAESFDEGWFRTGDMAVIEDGYYRIMGRLSMDIIKSGGYKLSALEIEAALLEHPAVRECAVVGISDETWGEMVAVVVVPESGSESLSLADLQDWAKGRLSPYKLPRRMVTIDRLPRNAMGKVTKPALGALFQTSLQS